jgi:hypothetical protein
MTKPIDLLRDLQRLDEAGRDRYMKMLPHEDIVQTLKIALQESDKMQKSENSTGTSTYNTLDADYLTICTEVLMSNKQKVAATTNYATSSRKVSDAQPGLPEKKRNAKDGEMTARKRPRVDRIVTPLPNRSKVCNDNAGNLAVSKKSTGFLEHDNDDGEDRMSAECKVNATAKSSPGATPATPSTPGKQEREQQVATPVPKLPKPPKMALPMVLCIPGDDGVRYKNMDSVPLALRSALEQGFRKMTSSCLSRMNRYRWIARNPTSYSDKAHCVRNLLTQAKDKVIDQGEERKYIANERCINAKEPCMHLAQHKGVPTLCVVPLPEELRQGRKWREPKFWIDT